MDLAFVCAGLAGTRTQRDLEMNTLIIVILVCSSVLGSVLMAWAIQKGRKYDEEIAALASKRNWRLDRVASTTTKPGYTALSDPAAGWHLYLYLGNRSGASGYSLWCRPDLGMTTGLAVYAPPLPEKTQKMFNLMMGKAGGLGRILLDSLFKGLGPDARDLRTIEDDDHATLMTTRGMEHAFDPVKGATQLSDLNQFGETPADVPYFVRDNKGLSLRINKSLKTASDVETYIDLAVSLASRFEHRPNDS